jgi:thiamine transport system substrate-binding protein
LPDGFETLIQPETSYILGPDEAQEMSEKAIAAWRDGLAAR